MKKLGLVAVIAMLAVSCNTKPGGNKGVLEVEHPEYTAEEVHHRTEAIAKGHGEEHKEVKEEVKADSTTVVVEEVKADSVK